MTRVEEIRDRLAARTPGAWYGGVMVFAPQDKEHDQVVAATGDVVRPTCEADAEFIAHAPSDIAYLLERIDALEKDAAEADEYARLAESTLTRLREELDRLIAAARAMKGEIGRAIDGEGMPFALPHTLDFFALLDALDPKEVEDD